MKEKPPRHRTAQCLLQTSQVGIFRACNFTGGQGEMVCHGERVGAQTQLVHPGYAATLNARARKLAASAGWLHIQANITLDHRINAPERIEAFHSVGSEQVKNIPDHIETLLIPAGSCKTLFPFMHETKGMAVLVRLR